MWQRFKNIYHLLGAILSNIIFLFPGKQMTVVGVTGTDGKTTTVYLINHILNKSGRSSSMLTSICAKIGDKEYNTGFHVTTPSPFSLQKILRKAVAAKSKYFVLEVTSHALDQHREWGIPFKIGVLTNITSEHLDYHKTFDNYVSTKSKLLKKAEYAVVNHDDGSYTMLSDAKNTKSNSKWITYGLHESADLNPQKFNYESKVLIGNFNKYNVLAATAVCQILGIAEEEIKEAIKTFKMPLGRLDVVYEDEFRVVIDFAHTPNSFEQILNSLRSTTQGKIIHVFGSAGERDHDKRPFMGEISSKYADILILTAEDPRTEDVEKISIEIERGIQKEDAQVLKIPDRKQAIKTAIEMAEPFDLVLITGKGHEKSMTFGKEEKPWNEHEIVKDALSSRS